MMAIGLVIAQHHDVDTRWLYVPDKGELLHRGNEIHDSRKDAKVVMIDSQVDTIDLLKGRVSQANFLDEKGWVGREDK